MTKQDLIEELDYMIDEQMNIMNLQSDNFNEYLLKTLWHIKSMAVEL